MAGVTGAISDDRRGTAVQPKTDELIAAVYEAALLPERWDRLPDWLARRLGAATGVLLRRDASAGRAPDDDLQAMLAIPASSTDTAPWVLHLAGFPDVQVAIDARRRLGALLPHLARAVAIAQGRALHEARLTVAALDQVGAGAAILDDAGRVLAANARFVAQLGLAGEPMGVPMRLGQRRDVALLRTVLAQAIGGGVRGAVPIHDEAGSCVAALHLLPVGGDDRETGARAYPVTALVLVATPRAAALPSPTLLRSLFGLTRTETAITRAIASGDAIERIAHATATSVETVRSHLKRVFSKTGTTRQLELALLVRGFGLFDAPVREHV